MAQFDAFDLDEKDNFVVKRGQTYTLADFFDVVHRQTVEVDFEYIGAASVTTLNADADYQGNLIDYSFSGVHWITYQGTVDSGFPDQLSDFTITIEENARSGSFSIVDLLNMNRISSAGAWWTDGWESKSVTSSTSILRGNFIIEPLPLFTATQDTVNFTSLLPDQITAVNDGALLYNALGGNDKVWLPNADGLIAGTTKFWNSTSTFSASAGDDQVVGGKLADTIDGGANNDTIYGGGGGDKLIGGGGLDRLYGNAGNDTLNGGIGADFLNGGRETATPQLNGTYEKDAAVFQSGYLKDLIGSTTTDPFSSQQNVSVSQASEIDQLTNIEFAQFADGKVPLFKWSFDIKRLDDGRAEVKFYENGTLLKSYTSSTGGAFFDDATPVNAGTYNADIRANWLGGTQKVIECTDGGTGATTITAANSGVNRFGVQLHNGSSSQNSQGCVVFPQLQSEVMKHILDRLGTVSLLQEGPFDGRTYFDLPIDVSVKFNNAWEQPKVVLGADMSVTEGTAKSLKIDVLDPSGNSRITKALNVTLQITPDSTNCVYGKDWKFGGTIQSLVPAPSTNQFNWTFTEVDPNTVYNKTTNRLDVLLPGGTDFKNLSIKALTDAVKGEAEKISFKIVDIDIFDVKGSNLRLYSDGRINGDPTRVEKLLMPGAAAASANISIIDASSTSAKLATSTSEALVTGTIGGDYLSGGSTDQQISGLEGNDVIRGYRGSDHLFGGAGDDVLIGGRGKDWLKGGIGEDAFTFRCIAQSEPGAMADVIRDLVSGEDVIDLASIDANPAKTGDQSFSFIGTKDFSGKVGELRYETDGTNTRVQVDVNGDGEVDMAVKLFGSYTLSVDDVIL